MLTQVVRPAVMMMVVMTLVTGVVYPLTVTLVAQWVFPDQANGSLIREGDTILGSTLIGQPFDDAKYFWSRPSATAPFAYNAAASSGSNLGPIEPNLAAAFKTRIDAIRQADPDNAAPIPVDLVTASGSGLDPHISPAAAEYQLARVAKARSLSEDRVRAIVAQHTAPRTFGLLGEERVNVLTLNLELKKTNP